jgi:hypothetical protein
VNRPGIAQLVALTAAGGAAYYAAMQLDTPSLEDVSEPVVRVASARAVASDAIDMQTPPPAGPPQRAEIEVSDAASTFRGRSWAPPPPPAPVVPAASVKAAPTPLPGPPPLPFRFVGMLEQQSEQPTAFLAKGEALHVIRVGDVIDSVYQVESLSPTQVVLTYLPLKQRQTLGVAGGQP